MTETAPSDEAGASAASASTGDPVLDGIYHAVSARIADMPGVRIETINHNDWQEAYYISDGTRFTRINIAYNGKGIVGSIMPVPRDEFGSEIAGRLSEIRGIQFTAQTLSSTQDARFTRDAFNDFFPVFSEAAISNGLKIIGVNEESWNLRVVLASATARGELAIYCDAKGNITKHSWIGRPPQDPSLQQGLDATIASL